MQRRLIINGDDFGRTEGINGGIVKAFEAGVLTSASLMVRWPAAAGAAKYAAGHSRLGIGLHIDLGEWFWRNGAWEVFYEVVPAVDQGAVEREVLQQLDRFRDLVGRNPTHLDSHQHRHHVEPARSVLLTLSCDLGVPLRECSESVRYCDGFYGQTAQGTPCPERITVESLLRIIAGLPAGTTELGCHPAVDSDVESMYRLERPRELEALCDVRVARALLLERIDLCSFHDLRTSEVVAP